MTTQSARALVAFVARGADARDGVRPGDHAAVARVPAGLRRDLVLHQDARESRSRVPRDGALGVHGVAVAVVGVADEGKARGDRLADVPPDVLHLAVADQARVRHREPRRGDAEAAHEAGLEPRALDERRAQRVVRARGLDDPGLRQERAEVPRRRVLGAVAGPAAARGEHVAAVVRRDDRGVARARGARGAGRGGGTSGASSRKTCRRDDHRRPPGGSPPSARGHPRGHPATRAATTPRRASRRLGRRLGEETEEGGADRRAGAEARERARTVRRAGTRRGHQG